MTQRTIFRISSRGVIGIGCPAVLALMAGNTGCRQFRILTVLVAIRTLQISVGSGKRKRCRGMIKGSGTPGRRAVARAAIFGKSGCRVGGIDRVVILRPMARDAGAGQPLILTDAVAIRTLKTFVRASQPKLRCRVVIGRWQPRRRAVTDGAILGESGSYMAGIACLIELSLMAGNAGCR